MQLVHEAADNADVFEAHWPRALCTVDAIIDDAMWSRLRTNWLTFSSECPTWYQ